MNMPGFAAESSLYKTAQVYRGYSGVASSAGGLAPAQQSCGFSCILGCAIAGGGCAEGCLTAFLGTSTANPLEAGIAGTVLVACLLANCGLALGDCIFNCPGCDYCTTCTECHNTTFGFCFCNGQNCGSNSPCCAVPPVGTFTPRYVCLHCGPGLRCCGDRVGTKCCGYNNETLCARGACP
jgi:hypothetical protein